VLALSRFAPETKLFDVENGKLLRELKGHSNYARCVTFTPDGTRIITGSYDRTIKVWIASTGELLVTLEGHAGPVYHVDVSPNGSLLASTDARADTVYLWDLNTHEELHVFEKLGSPVPQVAFSPDGRLLAVSSWGGHVSLFDTKTYEARKRFGRTSGAHWSEFSPDGQWLAIVTNSPRVYVFRANTSADTETENRIRSLLAEFEDDSYEVREQAAKELAALGPAAEDQLREAVSSPSAEVRWRARELLRRLSRPESAVQLEGHRGELECVCFSPDGKLMASGDSTGEIKVWRVGEWKEVVSLSIGAEPID
jgi:WD40 repeat protein